MLRLLIDNHIPFIDEYFSDHFCITRFDAHQDLLPLIQQQDVLIVRSVTPITQELIKNTPIKVIATASSGHEHIDLHALAKQHIQFYSAHGANALAVTDYITSTFAYLLLNAKISYQSKVAIIGYGHVGNFVYQRLTTLGFKVGVYDPLLKDYPHPISLQQLSDYDVICLHPNHHQKPPHPSHLLINSGLIQNLKPNICIINAARGKIVDEAVIISKDFKGSYCTDVYWHEPDINPRIVEKSLLCTPHIAGHTIEAKEKITAMLSDKIHAFFNLPHLTSSSVKPKTHILPFLGWEKEALHLYNPETESIALKRKPCKEEFLHLRRAHTFRHDFFWLP